MQRKLSLFVLVCAVLLNIGSAMADDGFYVVAVGGGVGTKITSVPYTISNPGFYYLSGNLTYTGTGSAISITADNVTLDLMGFSLTGAGKDISDSGIKMVHVNGVDPSNNVEIRNGTVSGFNGGVIAGSNIRVSRIRAFNNKWGIFIPGQSGSTLVEGCIASNNWNGIQLGGGKISACVACDNTGTGILLDGPGAVIGNVANNNTTVGFGLHPQSDTLIMVDQNSADGNGTNYGSGTNTKIVWGRNAGNPTHMDYPLPY